MSTCHTCSSIFLINRFCAICRVAHYCSVGCQKKDWQRHKSECYPRKKGVLDARLTTVLENCTSIRSVDRTGPGEAYMKKLSARIKKANFGRSKLTLATMVCLKQWMLAFAPPEISKLPAYVHLRMKLQTIQCEMMHGPYQPVALERLHYAEDVVATFRSELAQAIIVRVATNDEVVEGIAFLRDNTIFAFGTPWFKKNYSTACSECVFDRESIFETIYLIAVQPHTSAFTQMATPLDLMRSSAAFILKPPEGPMDITMDLTMNPVFP